MMEKQYLETITRLFPISAVKKLIEEIAYDDLSVNKIKKYLELVDGLVRGGLTLKLEDRGLIGMVFSKLVMANNPELTFLFLSILRFVKTFDLETYTSLNEGLSMFTTTRERKMTITEGDEARKVRKNLTDLFVEIRRIEEGVKTLNRLLLRPELNFELVSNFLTQNPLYVAVHIDQLSEIVAKRLMDAGKEDIRLWLQVFNRFPMIAFRLKDAIREKAQANPGPEGAALFKFHQALPEKPIKIVIRLTNKHITAILREQCRELIPDIPVDTDSDEVEEEDMLLCDTVTLKDFILKNTLPSQKLFLFLENISEFESFKPYNPRPFLKPFSAYRIMKEVLKEIYL
ncbi:MAG: hypothetical protein GY950_15930 [bacterium]|nr:hypothetical protein [bacterium]